MILTLSCAMKQYEQTGKVSKEMGFMLVAHWLYSNATVKGEHYIPCTWDMFHEKFGWMLNFWNVCGVPFLYCFQSFYVLKNQASLTDSRPDWCIWLIYVILIVGYYIFDTANSQKASLKMPHLTRSTFPQLPWRTIPEPVRKIRTPAGDLLVDGWYAFARKMQYTGDILMALSWGLICGLDSPLPYFYCVFFTSMIVHRQTRDEVRCKAKYGAYWDAYTKAIPNVFVPSASFLTYLFTGNMPQLNIPEHMMAKDKAQ
jgi:delta24(24(1))-sterol reductase